MPGLLLLIGVAGTGGGGGGGGGDVETVVPTLEYSPTTTRTGTPTWVPIGTASRFQTKRGRQYELDSFQAGTGTFTLDLTGRDLTPVLDAGPDTDRQIRLRVTFDSVDYVAHTGSVENWPSSGNAFPWAAADITSADGFDFLANVTLRSAYAIAVLGDHPSVYYPLTDGPGGNAGDQSGNSRALAPLIQGTAGGAAALGADSIVPSDPGTCLSLGAVNDPFSGYPTDGGSLALPVGSQLPTTGGWTLEMVFAVLVPSPPNNAVILFEQWDGAGNVQLRIIMDAYNTTVLWPGTSNVYVDTGWADGAAHHLAVTMSADRKTVTLYVDGVLALGASFTENPVTVTSPIVYTTPGGAEIGTGAHPGPDGIGTAYANGLFAHVAIYPAALTLTQVAAHHTAMLGYPGETAGARIARLLSNAGWYGGTALDTGVSGMSTQLTDHTRALEAINNAAAADQGVFFINGEGDAVFHGRRHRMNAASVTTVGPDATPISSDPLVVDRDRKFLVNDVTMSRDQGTTVRVTDPASITQRGTRSPSPITVGVATDAELVDTAHFYVHQYSQPRARIAQCQLDPYTHPALWAVCLGVEIGDRVTLTDLPVTFPATTMDFFVESVAHDGTPYSWLTTWSLSPVDGWSYWALGSLTLGLLGSTTRLGY